MCPRPPTWTRRNGKPAAAATARRCPDHGICKPVAAVHVGSLAEWLNAMMTSAGTNQEAVAAAPEVPAVPDDMVYGFGRMDESGRIADRAMTGALGWKPGTG